MFYSIRRLYNKGKLTIDELRKLVEVKPEWLSAEQFEEITGETYKEDDADESTEDTGNH